MVVEDEDEGDTLYVSALDFSAQISALNLCASYARTTKQGFSRAEKESMNTLHSMYVAEVINTFHKHS